MMLRVMLSAQEMKREEDALDRFLGLGGMGGKPSQAARAAVGSVDRLIGPVGSGYIEGGVLSHCLERITQRLPTRVE